MAELFPSAGTITSDAHSSRWMANQSCCIDSGGTPDQFAVSAGAGSASLNVGERLIFRARPLAATTGDPGASSPRGAAAPVTNEYDRGPARSSGPRGLLKRVVRAPSGSNGPSSWTWDLPQHLEPQSSLDLPRLEDAPGPEIRQGRGDDGEGDRRHHSGGEHQGHLRLLRALGQLGRTNDAVAVLERRPGRVQL